MSHAREKTLTFFIMYLSPLMSEVYLLVTFFKVIRYMYLYSSVDFYIVGMSHARETTLTFFVMYEGMSINKKPIPFPMDQAGQDFHVLFLYMFYTWVQNCTHIESFFNKILNVKHG